MQCTPFIPCFAESCSARGPSDKSDPEMTSKRSEFTQPGEEGDGTRGYEPADLRFGAVRIYKYADQFWLYRHRLAAVIGRSFSPRETYTYTRMTLSSIKYSRCIS